MIAIPFPALIDHVFQRPRGSDLILQNVPKRFDLLLTRLMLPERDHEIELSAVPVKPTWQRVVLPVPQHNPVAQIGENASVISRFITVGDGIVSGDAPNLRLYYHARLPTAIGAIFDNDEVRCERDNLGLWLFTKGANLVAIRNLYLGFDPDRLVRAR